jgi:hypothetical protein
MTKIIKLEDKIIMNDDRKGIGKIQKTVRIFGQPTEISARQLKHKSLNLVFSIPECLRNIRVKYVSQNTPTE